MSRKKTEPIAGYDKCGNCINQKEIDDWDKQQKKKQHYIYVARLDNFIFNEVSKFRVNFLVNFEPIQKNSFGFLKSIDCKEYQFNPYNIKLKKGEQVRIPIDVEKAEKV